MKVHWTEEAARDLEAIYDYIAADSPHHALKMVEKLLGRSDQIAQFPYSGRKIRDQDCDALREVIEGRYRIGYRILDDRIEVLKLVHTSREH